MTAAGLKTKKPTKANRWREAAYGRESVDREARVIRGVKILGLQSRNGRDYLPEAAQKAMPLYEGANVYVDHPSRGETGERKLRDKFGWLENVRIDSDGGLRGDLHYLQAHPLTELILEAAERKPDSFGLSHNAAGEESRKNGRSVVTEIAEVVSVDVVTDPATNKGLFEGVQPMTKVKLSEVVAKHEKQVKVATVLKEMMGQETMTEMGDYEMEVAPEMTAEEQIDQAFRSIVVQILDDASLDTQGKLDKIKSVLVAKDDAQAAVSGEEASSSGEAASKEGSEQTMNESDAIKAMKAELANLREQADKDRAEKDRALLREDCRKLLESSNRDVSDVRVSALMAVEQKARKALVESWPVKQAQPSGNGAQRPSRSPSAFSESVDQSEYPKSREEFRKQLALR